MKSHDSASRSRVRFGGLPTPGGFLFELTGGVLCLDLANTLDERGTDHPKELLHSTASLLDWARQAEILPASDLRALAHGAARHPRLAAATLSRLVAFREHVFAVFSAVAAKSPIPADSLAAITAAATAAAGRRRLEGRDHGAAWTWESGGPPDLDAVLWRVAWSAAELLTSSNASRVRQCAGTGCRWLFLDMSKNRARRWCDMTVCGNRTKARRHYAKVRAGAPESSPSALQS
jgi:predicted RNA-binding Zn ribbon-like protein